jgi:hypothetical protein
VKPALLILLLGLLLTGCATTGTVETRKQEKFAAYSALAPELRALVDQGQIKTGMGADAVYIAWGPPGQIAQGEDERGKTTTWIYYGGYVQEVRYWGYRRVHYDYYPGSYVRAQVVFVDGLVKRWQTFPEPNY